MKLIPLSLCLPTTLLLLLVPLTVNATACYDSVKTNTIAGIRRSFETGISIDGINAPVKVNFDETVKPLFESLECDNDGARVASFKTSNAISVEVKGGQLFGACDESSFLKSRTERKQRNISYTSQKFSLDVQFGTLTSTMSVNYHDGPTFEKGRFGDEAKSCKSMRDAFETSTKGPFLKSGKAPFDFIRLQLYSRLFRCNGNDKAKANAWLLENISAKELLRDVDQQADATVDVQAEPSMFAIGCNREGKIWQISTEPNTPVVLTATIVSDGKDSKAASPTKIVAKLQAYQIYFPEPELMEGFGDWREQFKQTAFDSRSQADKFKQMFQETVKAVGKKIVQLLKSAQSADWHA